MVCLDTSILIDYLKGEAGIVALVASYAKEGKLSTTAITEYELLKHQDKIKRELSEELLSTMKIYSLDRDAAKEASSLYQNLKGKGKIVNENDILIAGIAFSNNESIITRDQGFKYLEESNRIKIF